MEKLSIFDIREQYDKAVELQKEYRKSQKLINELYESNKKIVNELFEKLPEIILWKKSLITESDWFFIEDYIDHKTYWCSNFNTKYEINDKFDYEVKNGKMCFRPKAIGEMFNGKYRNI